MIRLTVLLAAGLLTTIFLFELACRAAASVSGLDIWLKEILLQRKDDQMRFLRRTSPPQILFLGSSATMCAIDPDVLAAKFGLTSYNAGIFRGAMSYIVRWSNDFVLRRLIPDVLVIEVWLPTLNDRSGMLEHLDLYEDAPYFTSRRRLRPLYEAGYWLTSLRVLPQLASPRQLATTLVSMKTHRKWLAWRRLRTVEGVIGDLGQSIEHDRKSTYRTGPRLQAALADMLKDWEVGGGEWQALSALINKASTAGIEVLLFEPPCTDDVKIEFFPGGLKGWQDSHVRVRELACSLNAVWLEPAVIMTDERYFADTVHANKTGRHKFTEALGIALTGHGIAAKEFSVAHGSGQWLPKAPTVYREEI